MAVQNFNNLNEFFQLIFEKVGYETGAFVEQEIKKILNIENVDVNELAKRIDTISKVLDGDTDEQFSAENIIKLISDNSNAIKQVQNELQSVLKRLKDVENKVNILNGDENTEGSVKAQVNAVKADLEKKINANIEQIKQNTNNIKEIDRKVNEIENTAKTALERAGLVGSKDVDETNIGDGRVLAYNSETGKLEYVDIASGAGNNIIDDENVSSTTTFSSEKITTIEKDLRNLINEKTEIDDNVKSKDKTYSSEKIEELIKPLTTKEYVNEKVNEVKEEVEREISDINSQIENKVNKSDVLSIDCDTILSVFRKGLKAGKDAIDNEKYQEQSSNEQSSTGDDL